MIRLVPAFYLLDRHLFGNRLPQCRLSYGEHPEDQRICGWFDPPATLTIRADMSPEETLRTLCHEMAHVWMHHHGHETDEAHGTGWATLMRSIGLRAYVTTKDGRSGWVERTEPDGPFDRVCREILR